jgi:hypothetical protein
MVRYTINIIFDPDIFHVSGYTLRGSYSELGWNITDFTADNAAGTVSISGAAISGAAQLYADVPLLYIVGRPVHEERRGELNFYDSDIDLLETGESGLLSSSSLTASVDGLLRTTVIQAHDGHVYITGDCIVPLEAGNAYALTSRPNPFNPSADIEFSIPEEAHVLISVYDVYGRSVAVLYDDWAPAGKTIVRFDGSNYPAGVYMCTMESRLGVKTHKMILTK